MGTVTTLTAMVFTLVCWSSIQGSHYHGRNYRKIVKRQADNLQCDRSSRYRRPDGRCNNLNNIDWGSATSNLARLIPAKYDDGANAIRTKATNGGSLPSTRTVSVTVHTPSEAREDVTLMVMQWGQFLDHDMGLTPFVVETDGTPVVCTCASTREECINIPLQNDEYFTRDCLEVVRSAGITGTDGIRQQQNALTSFIDGSMIYGSSQEELDHLRGSGGTLRTSQGRLLPEGTAESCDADPTERCFLAGDERVNEQPGLTAMHTIFMRLHNMIAGYFDRETNWSDEQIFQESRKIVEASIQRITYSEYLPVLLGPQFLDGYHLRDTVYVYDSNLQPDVTNAFATAAYRYGHSLIPDALIVNNEILEFKNLFFSPTAILESLQGVADSLYKDNAMAVDRHFAHSVTRHLFETQDKNGFDLVALNIQRGRDHGLPSYNEYRQICGVPKLTSLAQLFPGNAQAQSVYNSIDDVDLFTGGMSEPAAPGGLLGPTFACLLGDQFRKLKIGDRFFYLNRDQNTGFTQAQIDEINAVTLSKIVCENTERRDIQENAFLPESASNRRRACRDIPRMNLSVWTNINSDGGGGGGGDGGRDGGGRNPRPRG